MARLDLPDGQWIDVKDKLQVRDKRDVHSYSVDGVSSDGKTYRFNVVKHQIASAAVRITGWSLPECSRLASGRRRPTALPSSKGLMRTYSTPSRLRSTRTTRPSPRRPTRKKTR